MSSRKGITPLKMWETANSDGFENRYFRTGDTFMMNQAVKSLSHPAFHVLMYMHIECAGKIDFKFPYGRFKDIISKGGFQREDFKMH